MKKSLFIFILICGQLLIAQHTISGTFSPADDYSWLIAYRLKAGTQRYVVDTVIKDGKFILNLPENAQPGTYRLVYAIPQEEFNFDVIYNGKESITLDFTTREGVSFTSSKENSIFNSYFKEINTVQQELYSFYSSGSTDVTHFQDVIKKQNATQKVFERKSEGLIANQFITANTPYTPENFESIQDYVTNRKLEYFKKLDFTNEVLQASGFLAEKATNYVFTALPLEQMTQLETEMAMQQNVSTVNDKLAGVSEEYKTHLFYSLWTQAAASSFNELSDNIYSKYLRSLASITNKHETINEIELHNRLRLGTVAPDITWKDDGDLKALSGLTGAENYVLVFWSSTCGHCLKELPVLHKKLRDNGNVKIVAVGLEDDELNWEFEISTLEHFEHAIALGKWESDYAKLYAINQTPTYFILDDKKRIISKPEDGEGVIAFIEKK